MAHRSNAHNERTFGLEIISRYLYDYPMLADLTDLADLGLAPSSQALSELSEQNSCAVCYAPTINRYATLEMLRAWLRDFQPEISVKFECEIADGTRLVETGGGRSGCPPDHYLEWKDVLSQAVHDSSLSPGIAIPNTFLSIMFGQFDLTLENFVPDGFLTAYCGVCAYKLIPVAEIAPRLERIYIEKHADGNRAAALAQPSWAIANRFLELVEATARAHRETA